MGQYYYPIFIEFVPSSTQPLQSDVVIRGYLDSFSYFSGSKLTEHSYLNNPLIYAVELSLSPGYPFYKSSLVWAGDYADNEIGSRTNLYHDCHENLLLMFPYNVEDFLDSRCTKRKELRYCINHTKREYVDLELSKELHPLPLLTCEGNGRGGGDYSGNYEHVGRWARDCISVENTLPNSYILIDSAPIE